MRHASLKGSDYLRGDERSPPRRLSGANARPRALHEDEESRAPTI
jgi:hypothetical protein